MAPGGAVCESIGFPLAEFQFGSSLIFSTPMQQRAYPPQSALTRTQLECTPHSQLRTHHLYTYSAADTLETSHGYVLASTRNSAVLVFHFSLLAATILLCWYFTSPAIAPLLRGRGRNRMGGAFLPRQRPKLNITKTKHLQL